MKERGKENRFKGNYLYIYVGAAHVQEDTWHVEAGGQPWVTFQCHPSLFVV